MNNIDAASRVKMSPTLATPHQGLDHKDPKPIPIMPKILKKTKRRFLKYGFKYQHRRYEMTILPTQVSWQITVM